MSTGFEFDFFISRRGTVAAEAREVADILADEGYKVVVQDYDFASSGHFVLDIDRGLKQARHLLILYSRDYDSNFWTQQEFANFQAARAGSDGERRIGLLRCDASVPSGLLAGITHGVLTGVADEAERRRIVLAVAEGKTPAIRPSPRIFGGLMPLANRLFTGREDLLTALHAALATEDAAAALTQAAVHGLGGVGKTTLAREYIARFGGDYPGGVWWISAADRPGTLAGLAGLAHALEPALPDDTPEEAAAFLALDTLARRQARFLLVYDNASGPEALKGLLPARGANVLITSRHPGWDRQATPVQVEAMPEDDAVALLQHVTNREDAAGARRLARELGCLPLALDQAGAYARETLTSFDDYARQAEVLILRAGSNPEYPASVAATFDLAIARAVEQVPAAEDVLGRLAWFAPENIPLLLLGSEMSKHAEALAVLGNLSLVTPARDTTSGPAVTVHRLVQAVMRNRPGKTETEAASRDQAMEVLAEKFPKGAFNDPALWPLCRALLPHLRALLERVDPAYSTAALAEVLGAADTFLDGSGDTAGAVVFSRRCLAINERLLGAEHPQTLTSVNNLAGCLQTLGDAAGALPLYRRALESGERVLGAEHQQTLGSVNNLAACLETLGDAAGALPLYRRALESRERVLGAEHPQTLTSVNNLAGCLRALGDAAGALPLYRRALESRERVLGAEHPQTLASVNNLAGCLETQGDAAGALPLHRRALESCERVLGVEHPQTLGSVNNLAACLETLGDAAGALPLYRRALESSERVLGAEHPHTLTNVNNLAYCLETLGDAAGALPLYRRALESRERVLGAEHPHTLTSVNNLAGCLETLGDAAGALPLYRRALESRERVLGAEHPQTLTSVNNLAGCLLALGDAAGALPLLRRAMEGTLRRFGPDHPTAKTIRANYEIALREAGRAGGATGRPWWRRLLG